MSFSITTEDFCSSKRTVLLDQIVGQKPISSYCLTTFSWLLMSL